MSGNIRRGVLAVLAVAAVFGFCLIVEAVIVWIQLTPSPASSERPYEGILSVVENVTLIFLLSGLGPSFVLHRFRIQQIVAYVAAGALSGLLGLYGFLFGFGQTFSLFGYRPPAKAFLTILADVFVRIPNIGKLVLAPDMVPYVAGATLIGALGSGFYWFLVVRRAAKRERQTA